MKICEECLARNNWDPSNFKSTADCDWCWTRDVLTHEFNDAGPMVRALPAPYQDTLDFIQRAAYLDCERFNIHFVNGHPRAGEVDQAATEELKKLLAVRKTRNTDPTAWINIDWVATKKRFEQAKRSYQLVEETYLRRI